MPIQNPGSCEPGFSYMRDESEINQPRHAYSADASSSS
jgi:hypothetical protein